MHLSFIKECFNSLIVLSLCVSLFLAGATFGQISTSELANIADESAEEIANKTYAQEQSDLQRAIFRGYDRKMRPVLNQSMPIIVSFHAYLIMYWYDEMAVWDPSAFNNVRTTMVKQWELWQPELRIANSVSGVNQYFEISRRSHATLTSISSNKTKVETYPTFSMRIGCNFDYSDYPYDEQDCAARLYTTNVMSEVELAIYYNLDPSVMLSWGNQSAKRQAQDWELLAVQANLSFYRNQKKYSVERPQSSYEAQSTWTLILLGVRLRRNTPQFWPGLGLPCLSSLLLLLLSFLPVRLEQSVGLLLANFFLQTVFLRDALRTLPPAAGDKPRIVTMAQMLLWATLLALALNLFSRQIALRLAQMPAFRKFLVLPSTDEKQEEKNKDEEAVHGKSLRRRIGQQVSPLLLFRVCCLLTFLLLGLPVSFYLIF